MRKILKTVEEEPEREGGSEEGNERGHKFPVMPKRLKPKEGDGSATGPAGITTPFPESTSAYPDVTFQPLPLVGQNPTETYSEIALPHSPSLDTNYLSFKPSPRTNLVSPPGTMPERDTRTFSMYEMRAAVSAAAKAMEKREGGGKGVRGLASLDMESAEKIIRETILNYNTAQLIQESVMVEEENPKKRRSEGQEPILKLEGGNLTKCLEDSPLDRKFPGEASGSADWKEPERTRQGADSGWAHSWDDDETVGREKGENTGEEREERKEKSTGGKPGRKRERNEKPTIPKQVSIVESDVDFVDDGFKWRKYGQKGMKYNEYPRHYYRCTHLNCTAKKQVNRSPDNPSLLVTSYVGEHSHPGPALLRRRVPLPASAARQKLSRKLQGKKEAEGKKGEQRTELSSGAEGSNVGGALKEEVESPNGTSSESG